jgi:hypothetical protein
VERKLPRLNALLRAGLEGGACGRCVGEKHWTEPYRSPQEGVETSARCRATLPGQDLKMHEDILDAVLCAYLAYYLWYWRMDRNEVFGAVGTGYIVNPTLLIGGIESYAA